MRPAADCLWAAAPAAARFDATANSSIRTKLINDTNEIQITISQQSLIIRSGGSPSPAPAAAQVRLMVLNFSCRQVSATRVARFIIRRRRRRRPIGAQLKCLARAADGHHDFWAPLLIIQRAMGAPNDNRPEKRRPNRRRQIGAAPRGQSATAASGNGPADNWPATVRIELSARMAHRSRLSRRRRSDRRGRYRQRPLARAREICAHASASFAASELAAAAAAAT